MDKPQTFKEGFDYGYARGRKFQANYPMLTMGLGLAAWGFTITSAVLVTRSILKRRVRLG